jgi:hypothetical protein
MEERWTMKLFGLARCAFVAAIFALLPARAQAAELLMLEQPGCVWCAQFDAQIAPAWPKTPEGRLAPLRRVDITRPWPADLEGIAKERFTPTFVLLDDGKEIGRIRGYVGDEFFWFRIGELLALLPARR